MAEEAFSENLLPGERIEWEGRPGRGIRFTARDLFLVPFSLAWCGFAIFWEAGVASAHGSPGFFLGWGGMFVCIGLYFVFGRFIVDAWVRHGMRYAVTDRRILISRPPPFAKFVAVNLGQLGGAELRPASNGRGTIIFGGGSAAGSYRQSMGMWSPALDPTPQFILIDNVRDVFNLVQKSQN